MKALFRSSSGKKYSPAHHKDGIVRKTKKEAEANEAEYDGINTEQLQAACCAPKENGKESDKTSCCS